jgi:hypothetical protein
VLVANALIYYRRVRCIRGTATLRDPQNHLQSLGRRDLWRSMNLNTPCEFDFVDVDTGKSYVPAIGCIVFSKDLRVIKIVPEIDDGTAFDRRRVGQRRARICACYPLVVQGCLQIVTHVQIELVTVASTNDVYIEFIRCPFVQGRAV